MIGTIESALQFEKKAEALSPDIQEESDRISNNLRQLIVAVGSFHSSASTIVGKGRRSTLWQGSLLGEPLDEEQRQQIQRWIPPPHDTTGHNRDEDLPTELHSEMYESSAHHTWTSPIVETQPTGPRSDYDSDTESDMLKILYNLAVSNYEAANYPKAEIFLCKILAKPVLRSDARINLVKVRLMLTYTYGVQGKWSKAKTLLSTQALSTDHNGLPTGSADHTLALISLEEPDLVNAVHFYKRACSPRRKAFGKLSFLFHESMLLLARIYEAEGDLAEAEVCRVLVPPEHNNHEATTALSYLQMTISREGLTGLPNWGNELPGAVAHGASPVELQVSYV